MSATAADIPPELFDIILYYVCEYGYRLLDLRSDAYDREPGLPNRKEAVKDVAASSLTCTRWAKICRANLFQNLWIKDYEDLRRFSSLVSNVPSNLFPVSEYVRRVTLVQRIGERPWLYLFQLQPSLFPFKPHASIHLQILDSPNINIPSHQPTHRRLFYGIPITLPMIRHESVHIMNPHFRTPNDLISLLRKFSNRKRIADTTSILFSNITWISQPSFQGNILFSDTLVIAPCYVIASVESPRHIKDEVLGQRRFDGSALPQSDSLCNAEAVWLTYSTLMPDVLTFSRNVKQPWRALMELPLYPSAQRAIVDIGKCLCQNSEVAQIIISSHDVPPIIYKEGDDNFIPICTWSVREHCDRKPDVLFGLFASKSTMDITRGVDCIAVICVNINITGYFAEHELSTIDQDITAYAWDNIAEICAEQKDFDRLELHFSNRRELAHFVEAQRAALAKLDGRIVLLDGRKGIMNEVDFNLTSILWRI
ncbi:hypothetical protein BC629DRAFT_1596153 [Irpex lacteus]|nr:hypothetical protein BC629DRAFT_1596153 [Irpex lacteus]